MDDSLLNESHSVTPDNCILWMFIFFHFSFLLTIKPFQSSQPLELHFNNIFYWMRKNVSFLPSLLFVSFNCHHDHDVTAFQWMRGCVFLYCILLLWKWVTLELALNQNVYHERNAVAKAERTGDWKPAAKQQQFAICLLFSTCSCLTAVAERQRWMSSRTMSFGANSWHLEHLHWRSPHVFPQPSMRYSEDLKVLYMLYHVYQWF